MKLWALEKKSLWPLLAPSFRFYFIPLKQSKEGANGELTLNGNPRLPPSRMLRGCCPPLRALKTQFTETLSFPASQPRKEVKATLFGSHFLYNTTSSTNYRSCSRIILMTQKVQNIPFFQRKCQGTDKHHNQLSTESEKVIPGVFIPASWDLLQHSRPSLLESHSRQHRAVQSRSPAHSREPCHKQHHRSQAVAETDSHRSPALSLPVPAWFSLCNTTTGRGRAWHSHPMAGEATSHQDGNQQHLA